MNHQIPIIPPGLRCPIKYTLYIDPVLDSDGHTFQRQTIRQLLRHTRICPISNQPINDQLRPNLLIRGQAQDKREEVKTMIRQHFRIAREYIDRVTQLNQLINENNEFCQCRVLRQRVDERDQQIRVQQRRINEREYQMNAVKHTLSEQCNQNERLRRRIEENELQITINKKLRQRIEKNKLEIKINEQRLQERNHKINELMKKINEQEDQIATIKQRVRENQQTLRNQLQQQIKNNESLQNQRQILQIQLKQTYENLIQLQDTICQYVTNEQRLNIELEQDKITNKNLIREKDQLRSTLQSEKMRLNQSLKEQQKKLKQLRQKFDDVKRVLKDKENEVLSWQNISMQLSAECAKYKQANQINQQRQWKFKLKKNQQVSNMKQLIFNLIMDSCSKCLYRSANNKYVQDFLKAQNKQVVIGRGWKEIVQLLKSVLALPCHLYLYNTSDQISFFNSMSVF